ISLLEVDLEIGEGEAGDLDDLLAERGEFDVDAAVGHGEERGRLEAGGVVDVKALHAEVALENTHVGAAELGGDAKGVGAPLLDGGLGEGIDVDEGGEEADRDEDGEYDDEADEALDEFHGGRVE